MSSRLFLVDGYALIYRAFYAMIARPLTTSRGENTSVAWGIANFLLRLAEKHHPDYVGWVNDAGSSFRQQELPDYKATRQKLGEELKQDFDQSVVRVQELLTAFRVPLITVDGYEADDVIATLAIRAAAQETDVVIVSGDKDFYQLIGPRISLLNPGRGGSAMIEEHFVTTANASERFGVPPERIVDFLALVGDSSDNVPGVHGIGEKTAQKLIEEFGDLDGVLARAAEITGKRPREALLANADKARLSKKLVTLHCDVPVDVEVPALAAQQPDFGLLIPILRELEFHSLVRTLAERGASSALAESELVAAGAPPVPVVVPSKLPDGRYEIADTVDAVLNVVREVRAAGAMSLDIQGTSAEAMRAGITGLAIGFAGGAWYLPFGHVADGEMFAGSAQLPPLTDPTLAPLAELLGDPSVEKVGHDIKYELLMLRRIDVTLRGIVFDTMLASFMIDPGRRTHALDTVAAEHFGVELPSHGEAPGKPKDDRPFAQLPVREAADLAAPLADYALRLRARLEPTLEEHALAALYGRVEMPLISVLADMEWEGIGIDRTLFERLTTEYRAQLAESEKRIYAAAGTEFNLGSPPQLRHVLFEKLQLPILKKTKTGASTDADVLEELAAMGHEVPKLMLEHREISKLLSTYLEALPRYVNPKTGRIHTTFNQIGATTGRLSSTEPNLQNIPIRTARGEVIRKGFVPREGSRFVVADYSQIELRLLAHLSGDPGFVEAFRKGGDIHRQTAAVIFGVDVAQVSSEQRAQAKTINFATIYGQGPHSLSRQLGISQPDAKRFIEEYFTRFAGVRAFLDASVAKAREKGYAETIFGRRRYIPELKDRNFNIRSFGERTATNSPIQGSAADLIKIAMVRVRDALQAQFKARLILQVHDELIVEAPIAEAETVGALVKQHMEEAASLTVPLVADVGIGATWLDAKAS
ncbi:MAG TPA: DNA polymerase I [Gemmatimonadales bacterium]|jgi:DNA polymerase-1